MRILHLDTSGRTARSHTRRLTELFVKEYRALDPDVQVVRRDLLLTPAPHVDEAWIAAAFTPEERRSDEMRHALKISDELVDEFLASDIYVLGVPMYNFSVPSRFKAYIDQIVRVGRTFLFEPEDRERPYKGLVHGKKLFLITARGDAGYEPGGRYGAMNHLDPFMRTIFGFMGVTDMTTIAVEYDEFGGTSMRESVAAAEQRIRQAARELVSESVETCVS